MPNVPDSVNRRAVQSALESLGIDFNQLRRVRFDPSSVELTYLALNSDGKPFVVDDAVAEITYSVPVTIVRADQDAAR
jgi:hypothetical protein